MYVTSEEWREKWQAFYSPDQKSSTNDNHTCPYLWLTGFLDTIQYRKVSTNAKIGNSSDMWFCPLLADFFCCFHGGVTLGGNRDKNALCASNDFDKWSVSFGISYEICLIDRFIAEYKQRLRTPKYLQGLRARSLIWRPVCLLRDRETGNN